MKEQEKKSLSLYVHIPFCKEKCRYCDFLSFPLCDYSMHKQYVKALCNEIEAYRYEACEYVVCTIFFGGGTPSFIDASLVSEIMEQICDVFVLAQDCEITIEGNPDSLTGEKLCVYRQAGVNRLSIGLQSANDEMLQNLGRVHNYDQFIAAYSSARKAGFTNINVDIMSGLPGECSESYVRTLAKVVKLQPEHISAYSLIVEEGTPLYDDEEMLSLLPSEEEERKLYAKTKMLLKNSGYERYEISNYAKSGYDCRHNKVYWTMGAYLGFGLGASSYLDVMLDEKHTNMIRFHGVECMDEYIGRFLHYNSEYREDLFDFIREHYQGVTLLKRKDMMEEYMFLGLRLMKGVSKHAFKERFEVSMESVYGSILEKYEKQGLLINDADYVCLTDEGIDVSNVVMAEFLL